MSLRSFTLHDLIHPFAFLPEKCTLAGRGYVRQESSREYALGPRLVRLGASDYDYSEVVSGLKEGEKVATLAVQALQAKRDQQNDRFRSMTGAGGMPGVQSTGGGAAGGAGGRPAGGAGGGAPAAGGGGRPGGR